MSTSEIDSILIKVEKLSMNDKKLLIKRVIDLLGETGPRRKPKRRSHTSQRPKSVPPSQRRSVLDQSIAAYAARHSGGSDNVDLDPALEAASVEYFLNA